MSPADSPSFFGLKLIGKICEDNENPAEKKYFFSTDEKRLKKLLFTKRSLRRG